MKTVKAYEFKDLEKSIQDEIISRFTNIEIEDMLDFLSLELEKGNITEEEFYKTIGCSKYYAEVTSWFVPTVYYEHHMEEVDKAIEEICKTSLFDAYGKQINL